MLTVMPCERSHFVHAIASSSDAGCLSRVMVPRFGTCDGFESADGDVRCAGLRERSEGGKRNLGVGVGGGCLRKTSGSGDGEERCENDLCKAH
jgi:hypothetical protein